MFIYVDLCLFLILVKHCNIFRPNIAHHWHGSKPLSFTQQKVVYSCPEQKINQNKLFCWLFVFVEAKLVDSC
jgi:hypothetical protein